MKIIVDLFNQHSGDIEELKRMSMSAFLSGADIIKLQLYDCKRTWGDDSKKKLELTYGQFRDVYEYCKKHDIKIMATAFDEEKFEWLSGLDIDFYKIASFTSLNNKSLCEKILSKNKVTFISTGLHKTGEFPFGFNSNIRYLFCIAEYPTFLFNKKLKEMPIFKSEDGFYFGYSDHAVGISAALKSYFNGAQVLEKHFTNDINAQNITEKAHLCSFTPDSLRTFRNLIRELDIING